MGVVHAHGAPTARVDIEQTRELVRVGIEVRQGLTRFPVEEARGEERDRLAIDPQLGLAG
ncbi:MAG: hypothetical protein OXR73_11570 [Myxococcales bacterium]|nr:hypothetical protein [Myxococcales bacterium]